MLCYIAPCNHSCDVGRPWNLSAEEAKGLLSSSPTKHAAAQLGALMHIAGVLSRTMNIAANKALYTRCVPHDTPCQQPLYVCDCLGDH
jgi:hypothetical protein